MTDLIDALSFMLGMACGLTFLLVVIIEALYRRAPPPPRLDRFGRPLDDQD
jgi:hypothetical protein